MAEDEVVPLKGRDGLAPKAVPDEPVPTPADRTTAAALDAVGVDVAEGGPLGAGLDGGAGEAVAREAALSVALAPLQCGPTGLLVNGFPLVLQGSAKCRYLGCVIPPLAAWGEFMQVTQLWKKKFCRTL